MTETIIGWIVLSFAVLATVMFLIMVLSVLIRLVFGFSEKNWRIYYKIPAEMINSRVVSIEVAGEKYFYSVLMDKQTALEYLEIFDDAVFIRKDAGVFQGEMIRK